MSTVKRGVVGLHDGNVFFRTGTGRSRPVGAGAWMHRPWLWNLRPVNLGNMLLICCLFLFVLTYNALTYYILVVGLATLIYKKITNK